MATCGCPRTRALGPGRLVVHVLAPVCEPEVWALGPCWLAGDVLARFSGICVLLCCHLHFRLTWFPLFPTPPGRPANASLTNLVRVLPFCINHTTPEESHSIEQLAQNVSFGQSLSRQYLPCLVKVTR